jgi:hypothetical protein
VRLMRFKCEKCGLEMALEERPKECIACGSTEITRKGWRSLTKEESDRTVKEECDTG